VKNLKVLLFAGVATCLIFILSTGCKKGDKGDTGPAGPDSVQYSAWKTLTMDYEGSTSAGDSVFGQTITASGITTAILNKGSVIGYMLVDDPFTGDSSVVNASLALQEYFAVGKIDLLSFGVDYSGYKYRYVIVPANVSVTSADGTVETVTAEQLKTLSYADLTKKLGITAQGSKLKE
jgi:hypothetical protein